MAKEMRLMGHPLKENHQPFCAYFAARFDFCPRDSCTTGGALEAGGGRHCAQEATWLQLGTLPEQPPGTEQSGLFLLSQAPNGFPTCSHLRAQQRDTWCHAWPRASDKSFTLKDKFKAASEVETLVG